jgi:hypothetical protein
MLTKADIEKYFFSQKHESVLLLIIGAIAILVATLFYFFRKNNFYNGAAIPLLLIGLIQVTIGLVVYSGTDAQRVDNVYAFDMNPGKLKNQELPRIKTLNKYFVLCRWIETALLITGAVLLFYSRGNPKKAFLLGLGITLLIQLVLMLGAGLFAEKRAVLYKEQLENFTEKKKEKHSSI